MQSNLPASSNTQGYSRLPPLQGLDEEEHVEKTYFFRLMSLILDQGRIALQNYILSLVPSGSTLEQELTHRSKDFAKLKKDKKLTQEKFDILYPVSGEDINLQSVDVPPWYTLARNWRRRRNFRWGHFEHNPPAPHEIDPRHDVVRIRNARNTLAHSKLAAMKFQEYRRMWTEISAALLRLGISQEAIEHYTNCDLDTMATQQKYITMKEEALEGMDALYKKEMGRKVYMITGFIISVIVITAVMGGVGFVLFKYGQTWHSCASNVRIMTMPDGNSIGYMTKKDWGGLPKSRGGQVKPIKPRNLTVIASTEQMGRCATTTDCCYLVRNIQKLNMEQGYADIVYSFLIGDDGVIYEGRGFDEIPATAKGYNLFSISLAFMGNYISSLPSDDSLTAALEFLQYMASRDVMTRNFTIYGLCQVRPYPNSPGASLYKEIQQWASDSPDYSWTWRPRDGYCQSTNQTDNTDSAVKTP